MRTTPDENARIGASIAQKLSAAKGPVAILLPGRGVSAIDKEGQPFDDPAARSALYDAIRAGVHGIEVEELDLHINDSAFADAAARKLLELMKLEVRLINLPLVFTMRANDSERATRAACLRRLRRRSRRSASRGG